MNGIINVYKEPGYTSHDVVARLRRILGIKRIGHTGTLDPAARGVLPVCIGRSTILSDMIAAGEKKYEARLLLGTVTDTYDLEGRVLRKEEVNCSADDIVRCVKSFIGEQEQIPPMYSAVKVGGKKLYELARKGVEVERKPRKITISNIEIKDISIPEVTFEVTCSKGTYIRTLCYDCGEALGCGGCMSSLIRTAAGIFTIDRAHRLSEIEQAAAEGRLDDILVGPDRFFGGTPAAVTGKNAEKAAYNGNRIALSEVIVKDENDGMPGREVITEADKNPNGLYRVYDSNNGFIGLFRKEAEELVPYKMLYDTGERA